MDANEYRIVEVADLPEDLEWMLIDEPSRVTFVVKRGCWSGRVAADGWAAYRKVMRQRKGPSSPDRKAPWMDEVPRFLRVV